MKTRGNPGPGAYNPNFYKTVKSNGVYTLKSRPITKELDRSPGPGAYSAKNNPMRNAPSYGFSTQP
jgi:hypothetical protein